MTCIIYGKERLCENDISLDDIITNLGKHNYTPLITKGKSQFLKVFDENAKIDNALNFGMDYDSLRYMGYRRRMSFSYEKENNLPLKGEIFYSPDRESLLYIVIYEKVVNQSSLFDFPSEILT